MQHIFENIFPQLLNSQALDLLEIIVVTEWEGLSFFWGKKEVAALCTNKLTREKCQRLTTFCCSGGWIKTIISFFCVRSGDNWEVDQKRPMLIARVGADPLLPPTTGWQFYDRIGNLKEDSTLECFFPTASPPCCITVSLSGPAREAHGDCEGEYKSTGLISMGRPVNIIIDQNLILTFLAGFQIGGVG